jgi:hypothetical protein
MKKDVLQITSKNINEIFVLLKDETELIDKINACKKEKRAIFEIQNIINAYFNDKPELYEKYFLYPEMRSFCLVNLLELKEYEVIAKLYNENKMVLSQEEKRNFIEK